MFYQGHVEPYRVLIKGEEHNVSNTKLIRKFSKRILLPKKEGSSRIDFDANLYRRYHVCVCGKA